MRIVAGTYINDSTRKKSTIIFLVSASALLMLLFMLKYYPVNHYDIYPPCVWYKLTGTYCPGCGTGRGLCSMCNGDILGLAKNNIFTFICLPALGYTFVSKFTETVARYRLAFISFSKIELQIIAALIVLYWILRNFIPALAPIPVNVVPIY